MIPENFRVANTLTVSTGNLVVTSGQLVIGATAINATSLTDSSNAAYTNAIAFAANADNISSGTVNVARLGSGTANTTTWLRGDGSWQPTIYPGAGIAVSTGSSWNTSKTAPSGDVVGTSDTQTLTNKTLTSPILNASRSAVTAVAASNIDCSVGSYFTKTASGALSWTVTNVPATGAFSFILELTNGGTGTQTWFTGTKWPEGIAPTLTPTGVDVLGFITDDGGTTWRGVQLMKDSK